MPQQTHQPRQSQQLRNWENSLETRMLRKYLADTGGRMYAEVPIGRCNTTPDSWINGRGRSGVRLIDGVRIAIDAPSENVMAFSRYDGLRDEAQFKQQIQSCKPEVIEVKSLLNRSVIGQAIVAKHLFPEHYGVEAQVVILCGPTDAALEWVCNKYDIKVVQISKASLPPIQSTTI